VQSRKKSLVVSRMGSECPSSQGLGEAPISGKVFSVENEKKRKRKRKKSRKKERKGRDSLSIACFKRYVRTLAPISWFGVVASYLS